MNVTFLTDTATHPVQTPTGYDLFSAYEYKLLPGERCVISTGLSIQLPDGCIGLFTAIPGLAVKHDIDISTTVMDPKEVRVVMYNNDTDTTYHIKPGYRIANLVVIGQNKPYYKVTGV